MSLARTIYILLFFIICWSIYYLIDNERKANVQVAPNTELPMFSGEHLSNISYGADGVRSYTITSTHLDYYAKSGNTIFEHPILQVYRDGRVMEWKVTAQRGILTKNKILTLYDNVIGKNLLENSSFESLETAKLSMQLDNRNFWTDTPVLLKGPLFETQGQAMKGNFADHNALLYNHVQGRYENLAP
ncbi:LPS export ABC transporter periplasmic protein LptC [Vibrio spartinae]|uniref:Lipopolysaccharide export system protein LptC n=1 Tax=Vibrio spartinae TaxID=1918945 RepID=A0ABX6QVM1_9VIBR|nr:LPS export ABC transporter periplasmic protein LptC [Vibrio spartinae]QMV13209.1 Lipopolysaccharide export system protein LptC [Vibrio spartinae]